MLVLMNSCAEGYEVKEMRCVSQEEGRVQSSEKQV